MAKNFQKIVGKYLALMLVAIIALQTVNPAYAQIVFKNEFTIEDNGADTFIIDAGDDVTGTVKLQFGSSLAQTIAYDTSNNWFDFSDDLNLNQNEIKNVAIENLASPPGSPVTGQIYFDTTAGNTFIWNGTTWEDATASDLDDTYQNDSDKILNVDNASGLEFNSTVLSDIRFNLTGSGDVAFQNNGVTYSEFTNGGEFYVDNIQLDGNSVQSLDVNGNINLDPNGTGRVVADADLDTNGLNFTLDADNVGTGNTVNIVANQGSQADGILRYHAPSDTWEVSSNGGSTWDDINDNTLDEAYDEGGAGAGRTITADSGVVQINGDGLQVDNIRTDGNTISAINLNGGITLDPAGSGIVSIDSNVDIDGTDVVLDADGPGGGATITLTFGGSLGEILQWDNPNSRFSLSDDVRVEGNQSTVGQTFIADNHTAATSLGTLNLGRLGSAWETLQFNPSNSQFELSDDINVTGRIGINTTTPGYNFHIFDNSSAAAATFQAFDNSTDVTFMMMGTRDPTAIATNANTGSLFLNTNTGRLYTKSDDGNTTNWLPSGLDQNVFAALVGTFGTPSITNQFVTDEDPRLSATSGAFGETSLGTRLDYPDTNQAIDTGYIYYARVFLPSNTTVSSFGVFTVQAKSGNVNFGLYSDNAGVPGTKLTETGTTASTSPLDDMWQISLLTPYDVTTAGLYWIAYASSTNPKGYQYLNAPDTFIPYRVQTKAGGSTTLPATATPVATGSTRHLPFMAIFE